MVVTVRNPRVSATFDLELEGGRSVPVTVDRDANELQILQSVREQIATASVVAVAGGEPPIPVPTDEELVPALATLRRMADQPREV